MIVSFSGIDSAGKSTQIELLIKFCKENDIKAENVWAKARGTPGVMFIKNAVRRSGKMNTAKKKAYRKEIYKSSIKKRIYLAASILDLCFHFSVYYRLLNLFHQILICDRYIWDSYVDIKTDFKDIDVDGCFLWKIALFLSPKPKVSFMFTIPSEESLNRDINKRKENDEVDTLKTKERKMEAYMDLIHQKKWTNVIDGLRPIEEIHLEILRVLGY